MYRLGINTGFAVNRYTNSTEWCKVINKCGVSSVQFTADLLNPSLPNEIIQKVIKEIKRDTKAYQIDVTSSFTGAFTRLNHLCHPNSDIRNYYINWFKKFAEITIELGCQVMGSHFGIVTLEEFNNKEILQVRTKECIEHWHTIAEYAKELGIHTMIWEPMSIGREFGETIQSCKTLQINLNKNSPLPFRLCLDVDHGDVESKTPSDLDPYAWLEALGSESAVIHLKQSSTNKNGHWPFTKEYNQKGKIIPSKVISILDNHNLNNLDLILELSFKERNPIDFLAEKLLYESAKYWQKYI